MALKDIFKRSRCIKSGYLDFKLPLRRLHHLTLQTSSSLMRRQDSTNPRRNEPSCCAQVQSDYPTLSAGGTAAFCGTPGGLSNYITEWNNPINNRKVDKCCAPDPSLWTPRLNRQCSHCCHSSLELIPLSYHTQAPQE